MSVIPNEGDKTVMVRWFSMELAKRGMDASLHTSDELFAAIEIVCRRAYETLQELKARYEVQLPPNIKASYTIVEIAEMFRDGDEWTEGLLPKLRR